MVGAAGSRSTETALREWVRHYEICEAIDDVDSCELANDYANRYHTLSVAYNDRCVPQLRA